MKIIKEEIHWLKLGLVRQPIKKIKYKLSNFIVKTIIDNGFLLYNTVTGCLLFFEDELDFRRAQNKLISDWFYVPEDNFDEILWVDFLRDKKRELLCNNTVQSYVIMTTMDCNARCFYCYEKGRKPTVMSLETANDICDFIIKSATNNKVNITWFGGEPLLNYRVIDFICKKLNQHNVHYISKMISNGLLFSDDLIDHAINIWNLKRVQITLDGTEEVYLKTKAYKKSQGDEFGRVIDNIQHLLQNDIPISIRLNQSLNNTMDLLNLADYIKEKFSIYRNLSVYNKLLFDEVLTPELQGAYFTLKHKLLEYGLLKIRMRETIRCTQCMADNNTSFVITPDGHLSKCEHFSDNNLIGTIYNPIVDTDMLKKYKQIYKPTELCRTCALYPSCIRLQICPSQLEECSDFQRTDLLEDLNYLISDYYIRHKS